jgi:hypothetical protein
MYEFRNNTEKTCAGIFFKDSDCESTIDHYTNVHHQKQLKYRDFLYDES